MESASARVISVFGGMARVRVASPVACARCEAGHGCGGGLLGAGRTEREIEVRIPAGLSLRAGDQVRLVISSQQLLNAAVLAYGVPLGGLLLAAATGWLLTGDDLSSALAGAAGLIAGVWMSRRRMASRPVCDRFVPLIEDSREMPRAP
jgi:sigma-E factor negative regulatory protein RseC